MRILTLLAIGLVVLDAAATAGAERRVNRAVSGFSAIEVSAPVKLDLVQGNAESLVLEGDEADLAAIETVVEHGRLVIRAADDEHRFLHSIHAHVTARTIEALAIAGSGDIRSPAIRGDAISMSIAGSGNIEIGAITANRADVEISGSGDVELGGHADESRTRISGAGDVKAGRLQARRANVSIAGSGHATVWATDTLTVAISGSGHVHYEGNPQITRTIRGSGSIRHRAAPS